jgi:murein DD-endopeptidase / murein LD-carboxypeptidase
MRGVFLLNMKKYIFLFPFIFVIISLNIGAGTSKPKIDNSFVNFDDGYVHDEELIENKISELRADQQKALLSGTFDQLDNIILEDALLKAFDDWEGTRYSFGGDSANGIDCSALTRRIYRSVFSFELPRVSTDQIKEGTIVNRNDLKPGDILYFRPENRVNHTAVYIGNSLFINASSSKGVILSSLDSTYWGKYFIYGVRVEKARIVN